MRTLISGLMACMVVTSAAAAPLAVLGHFQTRPDMGGARNRLCIAKAEPGVLKVTIATAYCPNKVCLAPRLDGMQFEASLKANAIAYEQKPGCSVQIKFSRGGALVSGNTESCLDEHPHFAADGWYDFVSGKVDAESCRAGL